jgi:hypothetical protein
MGKGYGRMKYFIHIYVNRKIIPVETIPEMGEERIKDNDGGREFKYEISDIL